MPNQYVNKVVINDQTRIDLTGDTVTAEDVVAGKTAHDKSGAPITGTHQCGEEADLYASDTAPANPDDGSYWVDFSDDIPPEIDVEPKNITENGTYTAPSGKAYSPVTVNVPTGTARSASDVTASGATVTVPAGLYGTQVQKSVASGTAGTPTASKSAVSNHAVTVTPSVTNTAGYITGGTKTGTGVQVTASELVSGNKPITANGTGIDVANYATVSVDVAQGIPIDVSTSAGMTAVLTAANAGKAYRFTGTTDSTYTNGDIYVVEVT